MTISVFGMDGLHVCLNECFVSFRLCEILSSLCYEDYRRCLTEAHRPF